MTLEDRIRKLEDRAELHDLVVRYFRATDDDDYATLRACFAPDARFEASGFDGGAGRDQVIAFLTAARSGMKQTIHTPNYVQIEFGDEVSASGLVAAHIELGIGDETIYGAVRYNDTYKRIDGKWHIASRNMRVIHVGTWDQAKTSLSDPLNVRWPGADPLASDYPRKGV